MAQRLKKYLLIAWSAYFVMSIVACSPVSSGDIKEDPPIVEAPAANPSMQPPPGNDPPLELIPPDTKPGTAFSWYYIPNQEHKTPRIPPEVLQKIKNYRALYSITNSENIIYLTFDEGYELGYSPQILDTLKANHIKAAFFITGQYINTQPELVKRMKNEGHLVCNHTQNHKDLALLSKEGIIEEITSLEQNTFEKTGVRLDKFLRPPMGNYSDLSLGVAREIGYTSVFWSMALVDWDPNKQPGAEAVYQHVIKNIHPGAIILLHAVSQSDTEALDKIIKELLRQGYSFSTLPVA